MSKFLFSLLLLVFALGCNPTPKATAAPAKKAPAVAAKAAPKAAAAKPVAAPKAAPTAAATAKSDKSLLFFWNPAGRPCQIQDEILKKMGTDLTSKVNLVEVSVKNPSMRKTLYKFGVRSLPTLILVDKDQKELHRFAPGIRDAKAILSVL